jgi:hypothetical protein
MTTIVTRLYDSADTAHAAANALTDMGLPASYVDIITEGGDTAARIGAARVNRDSVGALAAQVRGGRALLVARAPFQPIGMARSVMIIADKFNPIPVPGVDANEYIREKPKDELFLSILKDHRRFLSSDMDPGQSRQRGTISSAFGFKTLSRHRESNSAISGGAFMSTKFLPFPLLSRSRTKTSASGGRTISERLGWATVSRRS